MIDSILDSIKKPLGIDAEYEAFDEDIIMHINSVFSTLYSIGASPPEPFFISGKDETWSQFLLDVKQAQMVKSYMYIKVKLIFDPPATSFALDAMKKMADEWEWRLGILEFVFNPLSQPVDSPADKKVLLDINLKLDELEDQVEELDDEIDDVPDLTQIYQNNLGN